MKPDNHRECFTERSHSVHFCRLVIISLHIARLHLTVLLGNDHSFYMIRGVFGWKTNYLDVICMYEYKYILLSSYKMNNYIRGIMLMLIEILRLLQLSVADKHICICFIDADNKHTIYIKHWAAIHDTYFTFLFDFIFPTNASVSNITLSRGYMWRKVPASNFI